MEMPTRLSKIGDLEEQDHHHLPPGATCFFWGEYTPPKYVDGRPWDFSATNQLIFNFKKKMDKRGQPGWQFKEQAITQVAASYAKNWKWDELVRLNTMLVPIPPSKKRDDPAYDDRMLATLKKVAIMSRQKLDIRDCLSFDGSIPASHESDDRPSLEQLYDALEFDQTVGKPEAQPKVIMLFDDMLTSGAHYVAASRRLAEYYPGVKVVGQFVARRRIPNPFEDLDDL